MVFIFEKKEVKNALSELLVCIRIVAIHEHQCNTLMENGVVLRVQVNVALLVRHLSSTHTYT